MSELSFVVYGIPQPQGSLRAVTNRKTGKAVLISELPGVVKWKDLVAKHAYALGKPWAAGMWESPVGLDVTFWMPRPKKAAHPWPRRDLDKLVRAVADALTGVVYKDDSQITRIEATKGYADWCGAEIHVKALA